jgi:hypothetical protein
MGLAYNKLFVILDINSTTCEREWNMTGEAGDAYPHAHFKTMHLS